jgi:Domain of unknown function (DUF4345)
VKFKKTTINVAVMVGIVPLFVLGLANLFAPSSTFKLYGIEPLNVVAYSTIRGVIGGMLLGGGLIMVMGLVTQNETWYRASFVLIAAILICRVVSVLLDGWANDLLPAVVTELYIVVVMFVAARRIDALRAS